MHNRCGSLCFRHYPTAVLELGEAPLAALPVGIAREDLSDGEHASFAKVQRLDSARIDRRRIRCEARRKHARTRKKPAC
jgi:hypothetical protein